MIVVINKKSSLKYADVSKRVCNVVRHYKIALTKNGIFLWLFYKNNYLF